MKIEKYCKKCRFNNRNKNIFPCNNCDKQGNHPITCHDCRQYPCGNKKGVRICDKFKWW